MTTLARWTVLGLLIALRIPALVQPIAADQSLYTYIGLRILEGGAPYVDGWDQKPPGVHVLYAILWWIWPDERVVNAADLVAAGGVCWLLVVLGRRFATPWAGWIAAWIFALLGNPAMHRLGGIFQRGQCEAFIALAITGALVLATSAAPRRSRAMAGAGVLLGAAIWLKYNAAVFALPIVAAVWLTRPASATRRREVVRELGLMAGVTSLVGVVGLTWLAWHGALTDLWLATFDYNVGYSSSGYSGPGAFVWYLVTLPFRQARRELLWLVGLGGVLLAGSMASTRPAALVSVLWIGAAMLAIAINGRDLPQYFVQAVPALAFAGGVGLVAGWQSRHVAARAAIVGLAVVGFWRAGTEPPLFGLVRLGGLPGLLSNVAFDLNHWRGRIDRRTYLERFGGQREFDKFSALDVDDLAQILVSHSGPADRVLVFGFSPGALVKARRESASRFFWSLPVTLEFAADHAGYGSAGLLEDLQQSDPALVVLQRDDWADDSYSFFMRQPALAAWLATGYVPLTDTGRYAVWRRSR